MRIPKYKQHERMGEGDPIRMAGLDLKKPTKRNKYRRELDRDKKRRDRQRDIPHGDGTGFNFRHTQ